MSRYSFLDCNCSLIGPGGSLSLGSGAGDSEEGITITRTEDKNTMTTGADGEVMHSLHGGNSGLITVRLLKTSPMNAALMEMYNYQKSTSGRWGQNQFRVSDLARGDVHSSSETAFAKVPDITYAKEGGHNDWTFHAGQLTTVLGAGVPDVNVAL